MLYRISLLAFLAFVLLTGCVPVQLQTAPNHGDSTNTGALAVEVSRIEMSDPEPAIETFGTLEGKTLTITWDGTLATDEVWYVFSTTVNWVEHNGVDGGQAMEGFEFFTKENEITFSTKDTFDAIGWSVAKATVLGTDAEGYYVVDQITEGGHDSIIVNFK